jgi:hypothetical protein
MEFFRLFELLDAFAIFGIDIAGYTNGPANNGDVNEEFPNSQKYIPLLLAQKENRKGKGLQGGKRS